MKNWMLVGVALLCCGLVESVPARWHRLVVAAVILWTCLSLAQVWIGIGRWQAAAEITSTVRDETLARYPNVPAGSTFFYIGLPDARDGCHVWSSGITSAVRVWYGDQTLSARRPYNHGVVSTRTARDLILDFSARGWEDTR